jgi:hypothetical protein
VSDVRNWIFLLKLRGSLEFNRSDMFSRHCFPVAKLKRGYSLYCWCVINTTIVNSVTEKKLVFDYFLVISKLRSFIFTIPAFTYSPGFDSRQGKDIFLFSITSRPALGLTQPPIQWVPGALSPWSKLLEREADHHSPPSSAEVKNGGAIRPLPHASSWRSA